MKKILSLLLVTVALFTLFALPSMASTAKTQWQMHSEINPDAFLGGTIEHQWEAILDGSRITGNKIKLSATFNASTQNVLTYQVRFMFEDEIIHQVWYRSDDGTLWINKTLPTDLYIYNLNESEQAMMESVATTPRCDGTACSWGDDDLNGVCDTCGLVLYNFRYNSLEEYAQVHIANGQSLYPTAQYWLLYQVDGDEKIYILLADAPFEYENTGTSIINPLTTTGTIRKSDVSLMSTGSYGGGGWSTVNGNSISVHPYDVLDSSDTIQGFFPIPLHQVIQGVTEGTITTQIPRIGGTISVLIISGIGLLALLMGFLILVKVLRNYLPK